MCRILCLHRMDSDHRCEPYRSYYIHMFYNPFIASRIEVDRKMDKKELIGALFWFGGFGIMIGFVIASILWKYGVFPIG